MSNSLSFTNAVSVDSVPNHAAYRVESDAHDHGHSEIGGRDRATIRARPPIGDYETFR